MFYALRHGTPLDTTWLENVDDKTADDANGIRCPRCQWRPRPEDRWMCVAAGAPEFFEAGCGTEWNTFTTRGRCPGCSHQWRWTSCPSCNQWSLHEDWYEETKPSQA